MESRFMRGIFNRKGKKARKEMDLAAKEEAYPVHMLIEHARSGDLTGVRRMLAAGGDPNETVWHSVIADGIEEAPLHEAARHGHIAVMQELIKAGADINKTLDEGWTPVLQAAVDGQGDAIRFLAAQGAKLDESETFYGDTALHRAVGLGHIDAAAALVEKGANRRARNNQGRMPTDVICCQKDLPEPDMQHLKNKIAAIFSDADAADRKKKADAQAAKEAYEKELDNAATLQNDVKRLRPVVIRKPKL